MTAPSILGLATGLRPTARGARTRRPIAAARLLATSLSVARRGMVARGVASCLLAGPALSPATAQLLSGDGSAPCGSAYQVARGDTLSRVAQRAYGDPALYGFLADANWDALGGNPDNIRVGMSLTVPCIDASGQAATPEQAAAAAGSMAAVVAAEGPLAPAQLDTLFGPVALFPDKVLTTVLVAVTFPLDVVRAGRFVEESAALTGEQRAAGAAGQPWDDSVRELAAGFPELVTRMSDNIDWTEQAGEAVVAQTDGVLAAIQRLRGKAQGNGYLVDNEAQDVQVVNDTIVIAPSNPNVVYVPTYDAQVVYSTPVVGAPVYHYGNDYQDSGWDEALLAGGIMLGSAVILDEIFDDDDWGGWDIDDNIDWDRGDITIDRGDRNIERGDINIGGDRVNIDGGDRINRGDRTSIGDSDRPQVDRGDRAERRDRADRGPGSGDRARAGTLPAGRTPISNAASREVARQKIEARQATRPRPAELQRSRPQADRPARSGGRAATGQAPRREAARPSPSRQRAVSQNRGNRAAQVARPSRSRAPTARAPSRSNTFQRAPSRHRPSAASSRGRSSMGGGGRGGRGGGRRGR